MQIFFLSIILTFVCAKGVDPVDTFSWLSGNWEMKKPKGGTRVETWKIQDENTLLGRGFNVLQQDSTFLESIELSYRNDNFWYIPTVPDQNDQQAVFFKLVKTRGFHFVFENADHDFPQRIVYHMKPLLMEPEYAPSAGDTLFVRVEDLSGDGIEYLFFRK